VEIQEIVLREKINKNYSKIFEADLIDQIIKVGYFDKIKKGKLLVDKGDYLTHIPLILKGVVKIIRKEKKGDEFTLYYLEAGDTCAISFANCLDRQESVFKGIVMSDVEAIFIPVDVIDEWLINYKTWRHFIIDSYHFRLLEMVESIDTLAFMKMKKRIWKYLSDKVKISNNIDLEVTHQDIATDLNSSRVVISRIIKKLDDEGKISSSRNKVKVIELFQ
jgi:CRP/FNR family transcriptional regulator